MHPAHRQEHRQSSGRSSLLYPAHKYLSTHHKFRNRSIPYQCHKKLISTKEHAHNELYVRVLSHNILNTIFTVKEAPVYWYWNPLYTSCFCVLPYCISTFSDNFWRVIAIPTYVKMISVVFRCAICVIGPLCAVYYWCTTIFRFYQFDEHIKAILQFFYMTPV